MRAKTSGTFKLTKRNKTMMTLLPFKDAEQRNAFKNMMIDAQVAASIVIKTTKDKRGHEEALGSLG